ncbi:hypothetical protein ACP70R_031612 [Stipagrostis hirtigluma subsp. patula]
MEEEPGYPRRPGEPDCSYYVKFGSCRYGISCIFNHPRRQWGPAAGGEEQKPLGYPRRPGEPDCSYYVKFGTCKYGMNCRYNHPPRNPVYIPPGRACQCSQHEGEKNEVEKVKLNSLGFPLRPGIGQCSYYMHTGTCKFGTNCRFHHPDPESSENVIHGSSQQNFYSVLDGEESNEQLGPFLAPSPPCRSPRIVPLYDGCSYPERIEHQVEDSHSEPVERVRYRYTRNQLLELREVKVDCEKFQFAPLENIHLPDAVLEDTLDSSSIAPEANLAVNTSIASKQGSCDASITSIIGKDVHKIPKQAELIKSSIEEPSSKKPEKYYMHEEFNHPVDFGMNVSPNNSLASLRTDQVGCSIYEIIKLMCRCWS